MKGQSMADASQRAHLEKMLDQHRSNLRTLEQQASKYGIAVPLSLSNEITDQLIAIAKYERQLQALANCDNQPSSQPDTLTSPVASSSHEAVHMTTFDQRGQKVKFQYNAAGNISFGSTETLEKLTGELVKLKAEVHKAGASQKLDAEMTIEVEYHLSKATHQLEKPRPDKPLVVQHLQDAKKFLEGVEMLKAIVDDITKAIEMVQKLLP
jgi:hypothetical protein